MPTWQERGRQCLFGATGRDLQDLEQMGAARALRLGRLGGGRASWLPLGCLACLSHQRQPSQSSMLLVAVRSHGKGTQGLRSTPRSASPPRVSFNFSFLRINLEGLAFVSVSQVLSL